MDAAATEFVQAVGGVCSPAFRRNESDRDRLKPELQTPSSGILVINSLSFSRRVCVDVTKLAALPDVGGPVLHVGESAGKRTAIIEVPSLGFVALRPGTGKEAASPPPRMFGLFRKSPPQARRMAEQDTKQGGAVLRNEFFEVVIDPNLGAVRAIYDLHSRGPRLAQQLAMPLRGGDEDDAYTIMAADEIRVVDSGPVLGEVAVRGRLVDRAGQVAAEFRQTTRVTWGSRVIEVEVEIDPRRELESDPWNSYIAARFAWANDTPVLYRSVNQATLASETMRMEAPQFVEIRDGSGRTTILTAGLPDHRRCGMRRLDSLLVVRGETARRLSIRHRHRPGSSAGSGVGFRRPVAGRATGGSAEKRFRVALPSRQPRRRRHALGADHRKRGGRRRARAAVGNGRAARLARLALIPRGEVSPKGGRRRTRTARSDSLGRYDHFAAAAL